MHFNKLFVLASLAVSAYAQTSVATVVSDIATISTDLTALYNAITTFAGTGSLADAVLIHDAAITLEGAITSTTTDVTNVATPVSDDDGTTIYDAIDALAPTIYDSLTEIVTVQSQIDALTVGGIPALIALDLSNLNTDTTDLENAFLAVAPSNVVSAAEALESSINAAFATAIAAYS